MLRETDYFAEQSQMVSTMITTLGAGIALLMGIGAVFGAVNTMYSAVAARTREIAAALQAAGFALWDLCRLQARPQLDDLTQRISADLAALGEKSNIKRNTSAGQAA
mgnify:CR=1 FL=1